MQAVEGVHQTPGCSIGIQGLVWVWQASMEMEAMGHRGAIQVGVDLLDRFRVRGVTPEGSLSMIHRNTLSLFQQVFSNIRSLTMTAAPTRQQRTFHVAVPGHPVHAGCRQWCLVTVAS